MESRDINYFPELAFKNVVLPLNSRVCQVDTGSFLSVGLVDSFQKEKLAQHFV